jgi:hypothetical protein
VSDKNKFIESNSRKDTKTATGIQVSEEFASKDIVEGTDDDSKAEKKRNENGPDKEIVKLIEAQVEEEFGNKSVVGSVDGYALDKKQVIDMIKLIWSAQRYNKKLEAVAKRKTDVKPKATWVIGQAGAGKSVAKKDITEQFKQNNPDSNPAVLDIDVYRAYHPKMRDIGINITMMKTLILI